MRTIWKYPMPISMFRGRPDSHMNIYVPSDYRVLSVQMQNGEPTMWCEVDPEAANVNQTVYVVGTGMELPDKKVRHIGSVIDGSFVWHFYMEDA